MPTYKCSDGTRVTQGQIDRNIRKAKIQLISNCKEEYGYVFCQECKENDCKPVDCSHNISIDQCKKNGTTELAWDISNLKLRGRLCHQKHDKLNLKFNR